MGSVFTVRGWDRKHCPRQVVVGTDGRSEENMVMFFLVQPQFGNLAKKPFYAPYDLHLSLRGFL